MAIVIIFIVHWYLTIFIHSFFLHRYASHKQFTMSRGWEKFFYIMTWMTLGSNYLSAYGYGVMHRMHHAFADTKDDPHSPKFSKNVFEMMWQTRTRYNNINYQKIDIDEKFTSGAVQWHAFEKIADTWYSRLFYAFAIIALYAFLATAWWQWLLLPIHLVMAPIQGAIVNWFSHIFGYRNFELKNTSTNSLPFDFLLLGENYHNNHHKYGSRANFGGIRWHEIDITYQIIKVFNFLGIVKLKKPVTVNLKTTVPGPSLEVEEKVAKRV
ncbi:MAG: acyl-CoA desaturase [Chitinophagales bacterium]|nr:acyl-CoA desaturase [Chitinophagales bacterium]